MSGLWVNSHPAQAGAGARVALLLVVSPSYFGAVCDVAGCAAIAAAHGVPFAVDEAHGAHFGLHPALPPSALSQGADCAVQSTHKTLPALTQACHKPRPNSWTALCPPEPASIPGQASMLHAAAGARISARRLGAALQVLQSSSPSYLLLASLDAARSQLEQPAAPLLSNALANARALRTALRSLAPALTLLGDSTAALPAGFCADITRVTVGVWGLGMSGYQAAEALQALGVAVELAAPSCVVLVVTGGLSETDVARASAAFTTLAATAGVAAAARPPLPPPPLPQIEMAISPREAFFARRLRVRLEDAAGRISAELLCPYPPGIPLAVPGGTLCATAIALIRQTQLAGGFVSGASDTSLQTVEIVVADVVEADNPERREPQ